MKLREMKNYFAYGAVGVFGLAATLVAITSRDINRDSMQQNETRQHAEEVKYDITRIVDALYKKADMDANGLTLDELACMMHNLGYKGAVSSQTMFTASINMTKPDESTLSIVNGKDSGNDLYKVNWLKVCSYLTSTNSEMLPSVKTQNR